MSTDDIALRAAEQALAEGQTLLGSGRTADAVACLRRAAALKPDDAGVLYLAAVFAHAAGRLLDAGRFVAQARTLAPQAPEIAFAAGNLRLDRNDPAAAEALFRQALGLRPDFHEARLRLARSLSGQARHDEAEAELIGVVARATGMPEARIELAVSRLRRGSEEGVDALLRAAIAGAPHLARALFLAGDLRRRLGERGPAAVAYLRALAIDPGHSAAWQGLGLVLSGAAARRAIRVAILLAPADGSSWFALAEHARSHVDWPAAARMYERVMACEPDRADAAIHLGNALDEMDQRTRAAEILQRVLAKVPDDPLALGNLGTVLLQDGAIAEATKLYRQVVSLEPANAVAYYNLGNARRQELDVAEALVHYRRAIALDPHYATAHWNDAVTRLMGGDWIDGFARYEWRWRDREAPMPSHAPWWKGEPLAGQRILLLGEQGYGDMIHFARYVRAVVDRGGRVVLECYPQLRRLFSTLSADVELIEVGEAPGPVDLQAALMQLPVVFGSTPEHTYAPVPYLKAPDDGPRLPPGPGRFKIGLVWAGNPRIEKFHKRSATLEDFAPLLEIPGVSAYSLQVGGRAADIAACGYGGRLIDLSPLVADFAETAALVAQLDLVIAVDTAVAHLAGALGKPVWMMPTYVPDWRWLLGRDDTPWYPTMRLYRQSADRTWPPVIARIVRDLRALSSRRADLEPVMRPAPSPR